MNIRDIIEGKREWRAHMARVKKLPPRYQIVYREIQKYLFKIGPIELAEGTGVLAGIVDLFEEGVAAGKDVLEVTGHDVAAFCDALIQGCETYDDACQQLVDKRVAKAMNKAVQKPKA